MFKKFKDKLAEEVKSSPHRIQQIAQAAQAAVTSASSSISDITNSDLFSIGDNDNNHRSPVSAINQPSTFHEISLAQQQSAASDMQETLLHHDDAPRHRRLSNSSFSSDISFRLPTYESPSMYHLQSDMDVSASEAEEKGFVGAAVNLDRVTKEELYFAYRRTRDRFTKYKSQYGDLARHYKLLERENAKARNVLVETQDKALRRISELKEQCSLEQSAKAHLERSLRVEIEEKNMKIDTLNTKVKFLQENKENDNTAFESVATDQNENDNAQLVDLTMDDKSESTKQESLLSEVTALNNKVTKMEQLINKYKESLKVSKEKNAQVMAELQILSTELENKNKENDLLKSTEESLSKAEEKITELNDAIEKLQNTQNVLEFSKNKEVSVLKLDLEQAQDEILQLNNKIGVLSKREEEYAISLAENKLSIHKELETKEAEIKSLKDNLSTSQNEVQSLKIVITDYKKNISLLKEEQSKLNESLNELNIVKTKLKEKELHIEDLTKKIQCVEQTKAKLDEEYKCLELQLKQETAEKLAMQDRNVYLENRNTQLSEDGQKKSSQIYTLESELKLLTSKNSQMDEAEREELFEEVNKWKTKYNNLESEIQEERDELVKLQTEIEKLLCNHESVQTENIQLHMQITELEKRNNILHGQNEKIRSLLNVAKALKQNMQNAKQEILILLKDVNVEFNQTINEKFYQIVTLIAKHADKRNLQLESNIISLQNNAQNVLATYDETKRELHLQKEENEKLKDKLQKESMKNYETSKNLTNNSQKHNLLVEELNTLKNEKENLSKNIKNAEEEIAELKNLKIKHKENYNKMQNDNEELLHKIKMYEESKAIIETEKEHVISKLKEMEDQNNKLNTEIQTLLHKLNDCNNNITAIKTENKKLQTEIKNYELINLDIKNKHSNLTERIKETETKKSETESAQIILHEKVSEMQNSVATMEKEKQILQDNMHELNLSFSKLEFDNSVLNSTLKELLEQNSTLLANNDIAVADLNRIKESNIYLQEKVNILKKQNENDSLALEAMKEENVELKYTAEKHNKCIIHCQDLEQNIKVLKSENMDLKSQSEAISENVKQLELEMLQVRNSHVEIEKEKDHLNSVIKKLENNELNNKLPDTYDTHTQTENNSTADSIMNSQQDENIDRKLIENDNVTLTEENKRLQSDIEGLQKYLAKISKENSDLNDKLREIISSNDNFSEQSEISQYDLNALKNEIQSGKDKIDNLTRENTLLVEENLELKDQIHGQSNDDEKTNDFNKKYNSLLEIKKNLEKRVNDLEHTNWSINTNMQDIQANNEKLRLSNDKLGRRLDEALVSLRHLHSLQENTELEYLRNILYEYLTGSGTHSLTLAKVLSAVVKFNDAQTELVLQKEKERQGLLRQLGIIT